MHSFKHFSELPCLIKGEKSNVEGWEGVAVNVTILELEVLITLVRLKRYD